MDSKLQPGAVAAFIVGSLAVVLGDRASEPVRVLLTEPGIVLIGLAVAAGLGGGLGIKAGQRRLVDGIGVALAYGAMVPMIAAACIAFPIAPIAAIFGTVAWSVTIPAAFVWLGLLRWDRSRVRLSTTMPAATAIALSTALLVVHFTLPAVTASAAAGQCLTFPGEDIVTIAWSPDGEWLGVGSERDSGGIVRVVEQGSNRIIELASGPTIDASRGVAVGPGGEATYVVHDPGFTAPDDEGARLWRTSPTEAARPFADLPTPGLGDLTWTPDGIAAVQWVELVTFTETHRLVWVRPNASGADVLDPITPEALLRHPVLAPLVDPLPITTITVRTPSGDRVIEWPEDALDGASVTADGAFLVFPILVFTAEAIDGDDGQVVSQSTETGERVVLLEGEGRAPRLAAGRLAYIAADYPDNTVCVKAVATVTE